MNIPCVCLLALVSGGLIQAAGAADKHRGGHGHHDFPPAVAAFHDVMAPLWHAPPGTDRAATACGETGLLRARAGAIGDSAPPAGVNAAQWSAAATALLRSVSAMDQACAGTGAESGLERVHERFHELVRLVGHHH